MLKPIHGIAAAAALVLFAPGPHVLAGPTFRVTLDRAAARQPQTGRLVIYLIRDGAAVEPGAVPADGPFWDAPQPMYGIDVTNLLPGTHIDIVQPEDSFPVAMAELPPGRYRAQAVLDVRSQHSKWKLEPGNLFSDPIEFTLAGEDDAAVHELRLTSVIPERAVPEIGGVEVIEVRSRILSLFHGHDVHLRATVVLPRDHNPERQYPAVYEVPGFGGDHFRAFGYVLERSNAPEDSPEAALATDAFWIVLDPESANGHTLFADSANNGPRGQALIEELIPALEARYNLIGAPSARLLRGHSSGGWSTIWLAITYREVFGAAWSTAPDPVDFRRFQLVNIYDDHSMYIADDQEIPSYRDDGRVRMSIREEGLMEQVLGRDGTSAQQWASWQAVFGPRRPLGGPVLLYDPMTGEIDHRIAAEYRRFDIAEHLRARPEAADVFRRCVRLIIGDRDSYYLEEAVKLLKHDLEQMECLLEEDDVHGSIIIVPGHDHSSIKDDERVLAFPREMMEHLERNGHIPEGQR
jgi:hypothetical protein